MSLEIQPKLNNNSNIEQQKAQINSATVSTPVEPNKDKSKSFKLMVGATCLAGVIALGIAGHKNNWWRKAKNIENSIKPDSTPPKTGTINPQESETIFTKLTDETVPDKLEKLAQKINKRLSKEDKLARKTIRQYNKIYNEYYEFTNPNGFNCKGNYLEFLQSKGFRYETTETGVKIFNENNTLCRIIHSFQNSSDYTKLRKGTYIEYFNNDGKITQTVTINNPEGEHLTQLLISYYDLQGNITKIVNGIGGALEHTDGGFPTVSTTYFKNNRVVKEATYLNGREITSKLTDYGKKTRIFYRNVTGKAGSEFAIINGKTYKVPNDNPHNISEIVGDKFYIINYNNAVVNNNEILEFKYTDDNSSFVIKDLKTGLKKCKFEFEAPPVSKSGEHTLTYREFSPSQQSRPVSGISEADNENISPEDVILYRQKAAEMIKTFPLNSPDTLNFLKRLPACITQYL